MLGEIGASRMGESMVREYGIARIQEGSNWVPDVQVAVPEAGYKLAWVFLWFACQFSCTCTIQHKNAWVLMEKGGTGNEQIDLLTVLKRIWRNFACVIKWDPGMN